jgi:TATA-box binding protein (TBP) (component of TFIID and TFIIIB)
MKKIGLILLILIYSIDIYAHISNHKNAYSDTETTRTDTTHFVPVISLFKIIDTPEDIPHKSDISLTYFSIKQFDYGDKKFYSLLYRIEDNHMNTYSYSNGNLILPPNLSEMAMYRIYDISGDILESGITSTTIDLMKLIEKNNIVIIKILINNDTIIDKIIKR